MSRTLRLRYVVFTVLACLLCVFSSKRAKAQASAENDAQIRQVVDRFIKPFMARHPAAGVMVGVSIHGQRHFFSYGNATDAGSPFTPQTLVEIGSCTKVFTTTLLALAANRHQLSLDDPAARYMPHGYKLQPEAQGVTLLDLADFTSGMPRSVGNLSRGFMASSIDNYTTKDFLQWVSHWKPSSPPPAPYVYSNAGIGLLGYLVADATGKSWQNQLDAEILNPLGMTATLLRPSSLQAQRLAQGHTKIGHDAFRWPVFAWYAAGGLRSTAQDMLSFGEANLGHTQINGRHVSPELIAAMKLAQAPIYRLPNGNASQAMAWVVNTGKDGEEQPEILKNGGTAGFGTVILLNPAKDAAIFIAINQSKTNPTRFAIFIGRQLPAGKPN